MNKYVSSILLSLLFVNTAGIAQVKKGALFLGGDLGYSVSKNTNSNNTGDKQTGFGLLPVIGKAVKDNLVMGVYLFYNRSESDVYVDENDFQQQYIGGGFFIRRYKQVGTGPFSLFIQGRVGYEREKSITGENTISRGEIEGNRLSLGLYPGISYRLGKKLHLETGFNNILSVQYYRRKGYTGSSVPANFTSTGFGFYSSLENLSGLYAGFRLLLDK